LAWISVSQSVKLEEEKSYRLRFTAKAIGVRREAKQFDNGYVGVFFKSPLGETAGRSVVCLIGPGVVSSADRTCQRVRKVYAAKAQW
jgi:hypothetical protein